VVGLVLAVCAQPGRAAPPPRAHLVATARPLGGTLEAEAGHAGASTALGSLLTYDYANDRDGVDTADPSFAKLVHAWSAPTVGGIYGQPLVDGSLVIVATESDEVYALDASNGRVAWKFSIGTPVQLSVVEQAPGLAGCGDINPLGITSTPVIDAARSEIFVAGEVQAPHTTTWEGIEHRMIGATFSTTSATIRWNHRIDPPGNGGAYIAAALQQRSGLTLSDGRVYAEYGGLTGDCGAYQGYAVSEPVLNNGPLASFKVPTTREGAIWSTGGAATSGTGELFVATGNSADGPGAPFDYGDSVIGLSPSLRIDSYFATPDWAVRNSRDLDLGSGGPIIVPGGSLIFEIGKGASNGESVGFLLNPAKLGGIGHPVFSGVVCPNDGFVFGADAAGRIEVSGHAVTYIYVPCPTGTVALQQTNGTHANFVVKWSATSGDPNGPPIIAGGLVWALSTGADGGSGAAALLGMDPVSGALKVTESVSPVEHFATPGAGDGMMFVPMASGVKAFKP